MKIAGIIAEYNPFHNGHKYHLDQVRKITGADAMVAVLSSAKINMNYSPPIRSTEILRRSGRSWEIFSIVTRR